MARTREDAESAERLRQQVWGVCVEGAVQGGGGMREDAESAERLRQQVWGMCEGGWWGWNKREGFLAERCFLFSG